MGLGMPNDPENWERSLWTISMKCGETKPSQSQTRAPVREIYSGGDLGLSTKRLPPTSFGPAIHYMNVNNKVNKKIFLTIIFKNFVHNICGFNFLVF